MYIIIVGGGNIGYYLAKTLSGERHEVLLLEKDRARYRTVSEELGEIVMQGDGCEVALQAQAGFGRADAVVAVTGSDDDNLVVCQMAKMEHNVPRTISRVNDPRNEKLFHELGIDATVSSTKIIFNLLEQEVGGGEVIPLAALKRGNIEIVEIQISPKSPVAGAEIRTLLTEQNALIVAVLRGDKYVLPSGDTTLEVGDCVIVLVDADQEHSLRDLFAEA